MGRRRRRAAPGLEAGRRRGIRKLEQYASWLEREWPSAAASLREGLPELFTVNRLGLPQSLRRCLTTTNIIDSSHAGVRQHTDRVSRWRNEEMAVRWAAHLAPFVKLGRTIRKHAEGILAYLDTKMTNGPVEGINNKLRVIARRAYGFYLPGALISMLFLCCGGIELAPPLPTRI